MKPLLLGEAPSPAGDRYWQFPLSGPPARVLCQCAGIPPQEGGSTYGRWTWALYEHFETHNVFSRHAEAEPWRVQAAREAWTRWLLNECDRELERKTTDVLVVVALGRKAADAIGLSRPYGEWIEAGLLHAVMAPHPSGRSRIMNDPRTRDLLGRILNEAKERANGLGAQMERGARHADDRAESA